MKAVAQAESEARSQNIKWGIRRGFESGTSKFYNRKCYGYCHDLEGNIIINEQEAAVVKNIFNLYLSGYSVLIIIRELKKEGIKSPTSKERWSKRTIDTILSNEKYIGNVIVSKTYSKDYPYNDRKANKGEYHKYQAINNHPPLIPICQFEQVQEEKLRLSNIHKNADGTITHTSTHYSMKSDSDRSKSL